MEEEEGSYQPLQGGDAISSDDTRLNQLGYKQELSRHLSQDEKIQKDKDCLPFHFRCPPVPSYLCGHG
ncbi:unnamed protein product [Malus baccata var. baccata]